MNVYMFCAPGTPARTYVTHTHASRSILGAPIREATFERTKKIAPRCVRSSRPSARRSAKDSGAINSSSLARNRMQDVQRGRTKEKALQAESARKRNAKERERERDAKRRKESWREKRREKSGTSGPLETDEHAYM